jgi:hypothetical protein
MLYDPKVSPQFPEYYKPPYFFPINVMTHTDPKTGKIDTNFADFDDPARFARSLASQPSDWHYRNKTIKYKMNSSGYRCPEWKDINWKEAVVLFGCSNVMGIGLAEDETIDYHVSQMLSRPVINLGAPGSGIDFSFYNSLILAENYPTPWSVVQIWTGVDRCTYFNEGFLSRCGIWDAKHHFFKEFAKDEYHSIVQAKLLSVASKQIWAERTRYFSTSFFDMTAYFTGCKDIDIDNQARDLLHPGRNSARQMAEHIVSNIS